MPSSEIIPIKVEEKILIHLLRHYPAYLDVFNAPMELAQEGIAEAIGINRTHIPRSMKKLMKRGFIKEVSRHVPGARRKRKVYFLTPEGAEVGGNISSRVLDSHILVKEKGNMLVERTLGEIRENLADNIGLLDLINSLEPVGLFDPSRLRSNLTRDSTPGEEYIIHPEDLLHMNQFFGRKKELYLLREHLNNDTTSVIVLTGIPGIGKTSLIKRILKEAIDDSHIFYHRFREFDTLRKIGKEFALFLSRAGYPDLIEYLGSTVALDIENAMKLTINDFRGLTALIVLDDYHKCSPRISMFVREALKTTFPNIKFILLGREQPQCYDRSEVIVDNRIFEMKLEGLTQEDSRLMLNLGSEDDELLNEIYRVTEGHPLSLELIGSADEKDDMLKGMKDVTRYLHEEIFSKLGKGEKKILEMACFFRKPFPPEFLFIDENITFDEIDTLVERYLLVVGKSGYEPHDLIKEFLLPRVNPALKRRYHIWVANRYLEQHDPRDWLEATYHFIEGGELEIALDVAKEKGMEIMEKHHFEEFLNILEILEGNGLSQADLAEILHFKGSIYIYWLMFPQAAECFKKEIDLRLELGDEEGLEEARLGCRRAEENVLF